ncbi:D-alanyl-D-alanine carboxypeptidase [soil metagenome]
MVTAAPRLLLAAFVAVFFCTFGVPRSTSAATANVVGTESKYSAIVIDAQSGEVLYAKRADSPRYPASITKVMTLYLTFEAMAAGQISPDEMITVSKHAASQGPTKLGLPAGATIRVDDAIRAIAVQSANDMAVAMAERIGGTESRFTALMTLRAQELGMQNTRYVNANGLPDSRQISTARDIAVLSRAVMRDFPQYYAYFSVRQFTYQGQTMNNHNRLLLQVPGVDGLKTGFTSSSGYNLAASAVRDGHRLIAVVLGGNSNSTRDAHVEDLLTTGFDVMRRRDLGERIEIAQNLFEREPVGPILPSYGQGDDEEDSTAAIQVADQSYDRPLRGPQAPDAPPPGKEKSLSLIQASTTPRSTEKAHKSEAPKGRYIVQVGAFKAKTDARTQLTRVSKSFNQHFSDAEGIVGSAVGGFFRAQFVGFTEGAAKSACAALKAKRISCMVVAPS